MKLREIKVCFSTHEESVMKLRLLRVGFQRLFSLPVDVEQTPTTAGERRTEREDKV